MSEFDLAGYKILVVDDEESLRVEIEEYVVTNEAAKRLVL